MTPGARIASKINTVPQGSLGRVLGSFWFHLLDFAFHFRHVLLVRRSRRFQKPTPSNWFCRTPTGVRRSAPRAYNGAFWVTLGCIFGPIFDIF